MKDTIKFYSIIENLVPQYVKEEFPLVVEFLSQYYKSQENQSASLDIINNIDKYVQIDSVSNLSLSTSLIYPLSFENEIFIHSANGFPKKYGLIKINDEIIWYDSLIEDILEETKFIITPESTSVVSEDVKSEWIGKILIVKDNIGNIIKTCKIINIEDGLSVELDSAPILNDKISGYNSTNIYQCEIIGSKLTGCSRGFSATASYQSENFSDKLIFEETNIQTHALGSEVLNLSIIFLKEFFKKIKVQIAPGFEEENFYNQINEAVFVRNLKQFYASKGTDCSFELLFRSLFGEDVNIIRPRDYLIQPSDAQYNIFRDLVVEPLDGENPEELENLSLFQDEYLNIPQAKGTISKVELIQRGDKFYYKISLDRTQEVEDDSNIGKFTIHPKTKATNNIPAQSDYIDVDSTIGFPESGEIEVYNSKNQKIIVSYLSKTSTQFLNCSGITQDINANDLIRINTFAYGFNQSKIIKVNITGVLSSLEIENSPHYASPGEKIQIETLGYNLDDIRGNNWIYNIPVEYDVKSILLKDSANPPTYQIEVYDENILKIGDPISLLYSEGQIKNGIIKDVVDLKTFLIGGIDDKNLENEFEDINLNTTYKLRKNISKVRTSDYSDLLKYSANVQNVYVDENKDVYVNSQSIPGYDSISIVDRSILFSGRYTNSEVIRSNDKHGLYSGDSVVYYPEDDINRLNIPKGIYFISVVDEYNFKLVKSRENIIAGNFIKVTGTVNNNKLTLTEFSNESLTPKRLKPQNILKKISIPNSSVSDNSEETKPGTTGIFVNGVELLNYKSNDVVHYGEIESILPVSAGSEYDIINPPFLSIKDDNGSGAVGHLSIKGSLKRVDIINPGFDIIETPSVTFIGGNGKNARVFVNLVSTDHISYFNAKTGINTSNNIIGFTTYHKFRDNEIVFYDPQSQTKISGLSTNSQYYVSVVDPFKIKLHLSLQDSISGVNTVGLSGIGTGVHILKSLLKKKKIGSVNVIDSGFDYETKKRTVSSSGISTFSNSIKIENHGYESGEIIVYTSTGTPIGGMSSNTSYYVTKISNNEIKLSNVSIGNTQKDIFYKTKEYVDFTSSGIGTHIFNYEPISLNISYKTGIGSTYTDPISLRPIFNGEITSVHLENKGSSYGSEIINLKKQPTITLLTGKNAQVSPIIKDGKIVDVIINNVGSEYYSTPSIKILGKGSGSVLVPIIENNLLKKVEIISGGSNYEPETIINVISSGKEAKFETNIKSWRINLFERLFKNNQISDDDGVLYSKFKNNDELEYTHLYAPRKLRSCVLGTRSFNGKLIYNPDLELLDITPNIPSGVESTSKTHSPIIGWAYDGNPIYGPYGYSSILGGQVVPMVSGYELKTNINNRPNYPLGIFVEDYEYVGLGNLDEHNGRFCVTPDFPNGVYAYFCTIDSGNPQSTGSFFKYKKPIFPYVIGNTYKSSSIPFNFDRFLSSQKTDINKTSLLRNTKPYGILNKNSHYDYFTNPNKTKTQISSVKTVLKNSVDSIGIITGGTGYAIGDKIILDNSEVKSFVSELKGKVVNRVSASTTSISLVEFVKINNNDYVGYATVPHNLSTNDVVNITSSYDYNIFEKITVDKHQLRINSGIDSSSVTGIVTYLNISGSLDSSKIRENDIYFLGDEQVKVLNINPQKSQIRILRNQNNTIGLTSISAGIAITENPRKFKISFGISTSYNFSSNKELYFDPTTSVGVGTTSGVGITSTLFLDVNEFNHPVAVGTGSTTFLYFIDIKDLESYTNGGYVDIVNATNSSFNTTKKKIVSIGESSISINFDTSSLSGIGVTAYINKWNVKSIPTQSIYIENHQLKTGDKVIYSSNGGTSLGVSTNGISTFTLPSSQNLYVIKLSEDLIGISTFRVGIGSLGEYVGIETSKSGILYFTSIGLGNTHSFKTNYDNILLSDVTKSIVTVETEEPHGISRNDIIEIKVTSGISTSIKLKYNKKHRRFTADIIEFISSDVDAVKDTLTLRNHKLKNGQKIIYTSDSPIGGLENDKIYYVIVVSEDKIRLSETYYNSIKNNPNYVDFTSTSGGVISKINPPINVIKNSKIRFDLSDSSLSYKKGSTNQPAFRLDFYSDPNFQNEYESSGKTKIFDVVRFGSVGVDSGSYVEIDTKNIPNKLYYKLSPIDIKTNDSENLEIIVDSDIENASQIIVDNSLYNGKYSVVGVSSTSFTYQPQYTPEISSYDKNTSEIEYFIKSSSATGEIYKVNVISSPVNFKTLPKVESIKTQTGRGAILYAEGKNIGKVGKSNIEILDIGFDYSSDLSLRPTGKFSSLLEIESFSTLESVNVLLPGKKYSIKPDLVLFDTYRQEKINDVILDYDINNHKVSIIKNTNTLSDYSPRILAINNNNGVGISSIYFNPSDKTVTVGLANSYSNITDFPFNVGDRIFVENISVGIGSTLRGYNSEEYNYAFFTITSRDPNIGGIGATISYSIGNYLNDGEILGTFDSLNSSGSGRVINVNLLPTFEIKTKKKKFSNNEIVLSNKSKGIVEFHDENRNILKVSTSDQFLVGDVIRGTSSNSIASIKKVEEFRVLFNVSESSVVNKGWSKETGFLNYNSQRIHDNDYYQYFSYSVQSKVEFEKWNENVSILTHTSGFKKFSDLIIDSDSKNSGMLKEQTGSSIEGIADIYSIFNINCYPDFDLVRENNITIDSRIGSNEITFNSKIIQDYIELIGNNVLVIDDISSSFNSNRSTNNFSVVSSFLTSEIQSQKYFFSVQNKISADEIEVGIISLIQHEQFAYINQYGFVPTFSTLGFFDTSIVGDSLQIEYYPIKFTEDSYDVNILSFNFADISSGIGTTMTDNLSVGDIVNIQSESSSVSTSSTTTILSIPTSYRTSKVLVQIGSTDRSYCEFNELTILHDDLNVDILEYGLLTSSNIQSYSGGDGEGIYTASIDGGNLILKMNPIVGYGSSININTFAISIANQSSSGVGTHQYSSGEIESGVVSISSSSSPTPQVISEFTTKSTGSYYVVSIGDTTNNNYQTSEIVVVGSGLTSSITEFGIIYSNESLGVFTSDVLDTKTRLLFTPLPDIDVEVRYSKFLLSEFNESYENKKSFTNSSSISFSNGEYLGTLLNLKQSFDLTYNQIPIFQRNFVGSSSTSVNVDKDTIEFVGGHFFATGEEIEYSYPDSDESTENAIGIATTSIIGIGSTNKLPKTLYIVKENDFKVKVSASSSDALSTIPRVLNLTSLAPEVLGRPIHSFVAKKQNSKCLITIDNVIQYPVVSSGTTTGLSTSLSRFGSFVDIINPEDFIGGDLIKINNEIMQIRSVGFQTSGRLIVRRPLLGTISQEHDQFDVVTKVKGNYNIINNTIYFSDPPYGKILQSNTSTKYDEVDYLGIKDTSTFSGRVFLRSGIENSLFDTYEKNYVFDEISSEFTGFTTQFNITSNSTNINGISTSNAIILINNVFQSPSKTSGTIQNNQYTLKENSGITSISFDGNTNINYDYDINLTNIPRGGIIVSVASTHGFGYQPLVSAGGTAIVSAAGTILSVSIGNSGSGYRSGIQTTVNVGVTTSDVGTPNIHYIGTASIIDGSIVSVAITNPGIGYTTSNPPIVIFDSPLSYSDIPLVYSSGVGTSGIGTGAKVNIVVGQGSSVINFEIKNYGFGYRVGDVLTVSSGGVSGIPTNTSLSFEEFQITVDKTYSDNFVGWSLGDLQVLDSIENLIDGSRKLFPIKIDGQQTSIRAKKGSKIDVQATLLVFINDVLQVPGEGYLFSGGSVIEFVEAPKIEDSIKILLYKGTGGVDVQNVDILEQVEIGDTININSNNSLLDENERLIEQITNSDLVVTNPYFGIGISSNLLLKRPVTLCKQTEDKFVNGKYIGKTRVMYEPLIYPTTNIISNVSTSSTVIFVENVKTFFDSGREYVQDGTNNIPQKSFKIISQDNLVSASATAIVSSAGTISSIVVLDGGVGYSTSPAIIIQNPVGYGLTVGIGSTALATSVISVGGTVSSIIINDSGIGYTSSNPPLIIIESPSLIQEDITSASYHGDFGIIVGISTTSVGVASTGIAFDLFIPPLSYVRNSLINPFVGIASTGISGIQTGYLFVVTNSNIGNGVTALDSSGSIVGIGTTFLDNIYSATSVSIAQTSVPGIGITYVTRVIASVQNYNGLTGTGYSEFFGNYSWGLISDFTRKTPKQFTANINGYAGISTSPSVIRSNSLKYIGYSTT